MNDEKLAGRVALVTGATSGLGRATALAFARRGVRLLISGRDASRGREVVGEIRALGAEGEFVAADAGDPESAGMLVRAAVERFGRLDCTFNNAAQTGETRLLADYSDADFERLVAVDLRAVWLGMKHQILQMLAQQPPGGTIVNTASVNALGGVPGGSLYAMAKAGVVALTKSAALEYASRGIRVNALVPGAFRTPMMEGVIDRAAGGVAEQRPQVEEMLKSYIAMGRLGSPEEAADAVIWLSSDASSYVTGHSLIVDGGMTAPYR
jgi:NAD(P)-dependent dehydrogenase (short-subunit alcohol dehydrogenase family)